MSHRVEQGISRRDLDRILEELGGTVGYQNRTGEARYSHPLMQKVVVFNHRMKDAPQRCVQFVNQLIRRLEER